MPRSRRSASGDGTSMWKLLTNRASRHSMMAFTSVNCRCPFGPTERAGRHNVSREPAAYSWAPARRLRDAPPLPGWSSRRAARDGALEYDADMPHLVCTLGRLENESAVAAVDISRDFVGHAIVASYQIRADRLVVLERHQPVRVLR